MRRPSKRFQRTTRSPDSASRRICGSRSACGSAVSGTISSEAPPSASVRRSLRTETVAPSVVIAVAASTLTSLPFESTTLCGPPPAATDGSESASAAASARRPVLVIRGI
jgi:hypothetical protein